jgi:hypothetical protein
MKRFTDTNKWLDPWFRKLSHQAKMAWFYIVDHCDAIGLAEIDLKLMSADCGTTISPDHLRELGERIQILDGGKIFIQKFIPFQYGKLSEACIPHRKVIEAIKFHSLTQTFSGFLYPSAYPTSRVSDRAKDKEEEEDKEEDKDNTRANKKKGTEDEVLAHCREIGLFPRDAEYFFSKCEGNGWTNGGKPIKNWKATLRAWKTQGYLPSQKTPSPSDFWPSESIDEGEQQEDLLAKMMQNKAKREQEQLEAQGQPPEVAEYDNQEGEW